MSVEKPYFVSLTSLRVVVRDKNIKDSAAVIFGRLHFMSQLRYCIPYTYINCVPIVVGFSYISNPFYKVSKWHSNATRSQRKTVVSDDDDILNRDCQRQSIYRTQLNTKYNKNTSNH